MRNDERLRAVWRHIEGSPPAGDARLDRLAARIEREAALALRARSAVRRPSVRRPSVRRPSVRRPSVRRPSVRRPYSLRAAMWIGAAAAIIAATAVTLMPPRPPRPAATLIEAVSGREIPDGAWVIAAAIRADQ